MRILTLFSGLAPALVLALAAPLNAANIPSNGQLNFDVVRKGKDIGDHGYRFSGSGGAYTVRVDTNIAVKVPVIRTTVYSFKHSSVETWSGGKLSQVSSTTNDDGTPHKLNTPGKGMLPASLWNDDIVRSRKLLNTVDGKVMSVRVSDLGIENVSVRGGKVAAHHYRLSGGLNRDLWYDGEGNLAHVAFTADDGSTVTYLRK